MKKALSIILSLLMIITTILALPFSASAEPTELSYTVTFTPNENFQNWDNVYFYYSPGGCAWPGEKMTQSEGNYTVTINPDAAPSYFIINNGGDELSNDLELSYDLGFNSGGSEIDVITPTKIGTCTITEAITYYDGELGAIYSPESTTFRYWAPQASDVKIEFYDTIFTEPLAMQKLKDNGKWTGVWTYTLEGYTYGFAYSYIVDGVKCSDPYGAANTTAGESKTNNIPTSNIYPDDWDYDCHVLYDDGEAYDVMYYLDIGSFMSNPNSGCADMYRGKYLSLTSEGTTVDNEGNVPTGISFLKNYSDSCSVCIDIANTSGQLMIPDCKYTCDLYNAEMSVYEVKAAIKALHDNGIAVYLKIDFSTAPFTDDMLTKYIVDTCTYWVNEYHIDGFILKSMISPENEDALRDALDSIDSRLFLAGTSKYRLVSDDYLKGLSTGANSIAVANGMVNKSYLYDRTTGNMDSLTLTAVAMGRGRMTLSFGQNFGGYGDSIDWSKLGNSYDSETGEPVFNDNYNYFRQLMEIRRAFKPLYSSAGTVQQKTSGNTIECNYTNAAENTDEWQKLKVLINPDAVVRNFTNSENWVVIAKSGTTDGTVDYKNGLEVINGTNVSVPAKSAVIMVDKASFDERNAVKYDLWVGGKQVTSANASDIFGDGKASFYADTNTLTLTNATITGSYEYKPWYEAAIYSELPELTIKLNGSNTITPSNSYADGIDAAGGCNVNIVGDGSLSINNAYYGTYIGDWETAGGNLTVKDGATVTVTDSSAAGIWVNHDINITDSTVNITRTGTSYNGMVSNTGGTVTVTNSNVSITNPQAALHLGNGDDTAHKLVINSGTVTLSSNEALGIKCEPDSTSGVINGAIEINGGTLTVDSVSGGTNITDITFNGVEYTEGTDLSQSGKVSVGQHIHHTTKVPAKAATTEAAGNTEYYICTCGKCFKDAAGTKEITDPQSVVIPKIVLPPEDAKLPTEKKTEEIIKKTNTDKKDVSGTQIKRLMLKATAKKQTITISWKKISGAQGYIIYGGPCGKDMKRLATVKNAKTVKKTFKKLKKGKYYKYMVVAYKKTADGKNRVICKSKSVHCCTDGGKKGNPTSLSVKKAKLTVKKGKTVKVKPTLKSKKKVETHIAKFRYESSNTKIATVDKNGKVKGKKKGTATIYVYAQDGLCKTVKVTVK